MNQPQEPGNFDNEAPENPFTADLKDDFSNDFGVETGPVSQIFKDGGFAGGNTGRYILFGVLACIAVLAGLYIILDQDEFDYDDELAVPEVANFASPAGKTEGGDAAGTKKQGEMSGDKTAETSIGVDGDKKADASSSSSTATDSDAVQTAESFPSVAESAVPVPSALASDAPASPPSYAGPIGGGSIPVLGSPVEGAFMTYDESAMKPEFTWDGASGGRIFFSRNPEMEPVVMSARVRGNSFRLNYPAPGVWFWQIRNRAGSSDVRSFRISPPIRRNVALAAPQAGGVLQASGGVVSWQGDTKVSYYRVELGHSDWANPLHRFATAGTQLMIRGVQPGQYNLRVGAFSEVAGRWEYTAPVNVTIQ